MSQYAFFFDESRCTDCRACSIACLDWNDIEPGTYKLLRRFMWEDGAFPEVRMHFLFAPCYHCEEPLCMQACPQGAIEKDDAYGRVKVNADKCTGCRTCWNACPYGTPQFCDTDEGLRMKLCTMCADRLNQGHVPTCVAACPSRALDFGPIEEMQEKYGVIRELQGMQSAEATKPSIIFKPAPDKTRLVPYDANRARVLFSERGDRLAPLYDDIDVFTETADGYVEKNKLNMKSSDADRGMLGTISDEF